MFDRCPECGGVAVTICTCPLMHSECMQGHEWHYEIRTLKKVQRPTICRKLFRRRRDDRQQQNV